MTLRSHLVLIRRSLIRDIAETACVSAGRIAAKVSDFGSDDKERITLLNWLYGRVVRHARAIKFSGIGDLRRVDKVNNSLNFKTCDDIWVALVGTKGSDDNFRKERKRDNNAKMSDLLYSTWSALYALKAGHTEDGSSSGETGRRTPSE